MFDSEVKKARLSGASSFLGFFDEPTHGVGPMMAEAGVTEPPTPAFWREMETPDRF